MRGTLLLLRKDLLVLRRSTLLVALLAAYPLLVALLLGLVAGYATSKPRVAFVDDEGLPDVVEIGGRRFDIEAAIERAAESATIVRLSRSEAERQLRDGRVVAIVRVPAGFVAQLRAMSRSPRLELETTRGLLGARVTQQMQALVYSLNLQLQEAFIAANLEYVELILHGGQTDFLGRRVDVLGLRRTRELLEAFFPESPALAQVRDFVRVAELALGETGDALRATANPIVLETERSRERTWAVSSQVQAHALGLLAIFVATVLAAATLAAERDERVLPRLRRGLASLGQVLAAKVALAALVSALLGLLVAVAFGVGVEVAGLGVREPWERVAPVGAGLLLAGAAAGALGALVAAAARETRTSALAAVLLVLPIVCVGLVPREVVPPAGWISDALPFAHAVRLFDALLYEPEPWAASAREALWLLGLTAAFAAAARGLMRRLLV